jgi:hypothetical protein
MTYVRDLGYPAPEVFDVSDDGRDLVIARVDGPNMLDSAATRPWRIARHGRELADLHKRLHALSAPTWLPEAPVGSGGAILHLDLHPLNVLMSDHGPVVIDWTNAARGDPSVDGCLTWALIASGDPPVNRLMLTVLRYARGRFLNAFLDALGDDFDRSEIARVVEWKATDPHMSAIEVARMRALS